MRRNQIGLWEPRLHRDLGLFSREMARFGRDAGLFGAQIARTAVSVGCRQRAAQRLRRRQIWGAGPWQHHSWVASPWPLGLGLSGLDSVGTWSRRRAARRYRSYYRRRRFRRTFQVLLGVALIAIVIAILSRQDDGSTNTSNWL